MAFYLVMDKETPDFDTHVDGYNLSQAEPELAEIAREIDVTPLMEFFGADSEEIEGFLGDEDPGGKAKEVKMTDEAWFTADQGLETVRGLTDYIVAHMGRVRNDGPLLEELQEFERVLEGARTRGLKWHLAIDY
jgi:hypothetical protein